MELTPTTPRHARDEQHYAKIDKNGVVLNVIVCDDSQTAVELGHPHLVYHEASGLVTQVGVGWRIKADTWEWEDAREETLSEIWRQRGTQT